MFKVGDIVKSKYGNEGRILYIVEKKYNPYHDDIVIVNIMNLIQHVNDGYIRQFHIPMNLKGMGIVSSDSLTIVKSGFSPKELLLKKVLYDKK